MFFKKGEFLKLEDGTVLEVVHSDEEKAVCLKLCNFRDIGWTYTSESIAFSNNAEEYTDMLGITKISSVPVKGRTHWKPLRPVLVYPMV